MKRILRSAIVEHPARALYDLVEDIESYPRFLPWCMAARVSERTPVRTVATLTVGVKALRQSFSTENSNLPGRSIDMRLLEGPFSAFAASWRFTPLEENASRIEFALEYEFSNRVLRLALEPLLEHIANTVVDAFTRRAWELHRKHAH